MTTKEKSSSKDKEETTPFRGVWIPAVAFTEVPLRDLSQANRTLYCLIYGLSQSKGHCFASNTWLANALGSTPNSIGNMISKLRDMEVIACQNIQDRRQIIPLQRLESMEDEGSTKSGGGQLKVESTPLKVEGGQLKVESTPLKVEATYNKPKTNLKQKQSRPAGDDGLEGDQTMAFLEDLIPETPSQSTPSKFDVDCASKLKNTLQTKNLITRPVSLKKWSNEFRILRNTNKKAIIKAVLKWYCDHAGQKYVSVALSAGSFRRKFDNLKHQSENQFTKSGPKEHKEHDPITKSLYDELKHLHWPKGTKTQLLDAIQDSVLEYDLFWKSLLAVTKRTDVPSPVLRLAKELKGSIPSQKTFVRTWFETISKSVENWSDWSGNLRSMALRRDHKKFQALGRGWSDDYCGDPERWERLMELTR